MVLIRKQTRLQVAFFFYEDGRVEGESVRLGTEQGQEVLCWTVWSAEPGSLSADMGKTAPRHPACTFLHLIAMCVSEMPLAGQKCHAISC